MTAGHPRRIRLWLLSVLVFASASLACEIGGSATPPASDLPLPGTPPGPYIRLGHAEHDSIADGDVIRNCQSQPLEWPGVANARRYDIQVASTGDFASPLVDVQIDHVDTGYQQYNVEQHRASYAYAGQFYYRLRAVNDSGSGPWSPPRSFRWPSPPSIAPEQVEPADGASMIGGFSFEWNYGAPVGDPFEGDCFHIQIAADAGFGSLSHDMYFFAPALDYGLPAGLPSGTYFWRLAACNNAGPSTPPTCGPFSTPHSFVLITTTATGGVVQGVVYSDLNTDGDGGDAGEGPLEGVTVSIAGCGTPASHITGADGAFAFTDLPAGTCHVQVSKSGWSYVGAFPPGLPYPVPAASDPALTTAFSIFMNSTGPTPSPAPKGTPTPLDFDWAVESAGANPNNSGEWLATFVIQPRGGDGKYTYFHDGLKIDGSRVQVVWRACRSKPGSLGVQDGAGALVTQDYFLEAPYCNVTPSPTIKPPKP